MKLVGLTGGIATGKSTVARMFGELGAGVIDADTLAREVVEPQQPALAEIAAAFGPQVLDWHGRLRRDQLARIVFDDPPARATLDAITHPRIMARAAEQAQALSKAGRPLVLLEAALLVETGLHRGMQALVVTVVEPAIQLQRVMARDGLNEASARARLAAQGSHADKLAVANHVIDTAGSLEETRDQVIAIWRELTGTTRSEHGEP